MAHRKLALDVFRSQADFRRFVAESAAELTRRRLFERGLIAGRDPFVLEGFCRLCNETVPLAVDWNYAYEVDGVLTPNWRERLLCPRCRLNARMRATIHIIEEVLRPGPAARVYLTEQVTPLYAWARTRFPGVVGSEWLGDAVRRGAMHDGVRHEDLTRLSFARRSFDLVVSLDVLEHVQGFRAALSECFRVLAPGGTFLLTCPFRVDLSRHLVRAVVRGDGTIEHREPPEYHGNPVSADGSLAFYHFGWELLDQIRAAGFEDVRACQYWSRDYGYLGREQMVFLARRPASLGQRIRSWIGGTRTTA
jgi:SAM-dependent methyltransferase